MLDDLVHSITGTLGIGRSYLVTCNKIFTWKYFKKMDDKLWENFHSCGLVQGA